jgi:hypothetical protein
VPTYDQTDRFRRDYKALSPERKQSFKRAVAVFAEDLDRAEGRFRPGLRVKGVRGARGVFELTFEEDGRAIFEFGEPIIAGKPHIIWRRVGTHAILDDP